MASSGQVWSQEGFVGFMIVMGSGERVVVRRDCQAGRGEGVKGPKRIREGEWVGEGRDGGERRMARWVVVEGGGCAATSEGEEGMFRGLCGCGVGGYDKKIFGAAGWDGWDTESV